jgi:flagellar hook-length control protein FliK
LNTDGLNLGLPLRGTPDAGSMRAKIQKKESSPQERSEQGPDSFAEALSAKQSQPTPRKENSSVAKNGAESGSGRTDPKDDAPSVKERGIDKLENPKAKKSASEREKAMLEFMDSMESEFGIPPQKIVEAMAQLPKEEMLQSPEETASQVIDQLDLPPEQAERAYSMYAGLLVQLSQTPAPVAPAPKEMPALTHAPVVSIQERRAMLNESLDRLNQKFFLQDSRPVPTAERMTEISDLKPKSTDELVDRLSLDRANNPEGKLPLMMRNSPQIPQTDLPQPQKALPDFAGSQAAQAQQARNAQQASNAEQDESTKALMAKLSALGASAAALGQSVEKVPTGKQVVDSADAQSAQNGFDLKGLSLSTGLMKGANASDSSSGGFLDSDDSSDGETGSGLDKADTLAPHLRSEHAGEKMEFKNVMTAAPMAATPKGEGNPNLEKIMNQAQLIVRKGGGEAVVKMNPEGMGQVHLKVIVKDGKVNVEMATETKEAKQMIESSLSDLKTGLGHHKLSVENVKVDVGLQGSNEHGQQKQPDLNQNQNREQARQFFQQFRDENLAKRDPFFETAGVKAYSRPSKGPAPLQPVEEKRTRAAGDGRGERMNLVA